MRRARLFASSRPRTRLVLVALAVLAAVAASSAAGLTERAGGRAQASASSNCRPPLPGEAISKECWESHGRYGPRCGDATCQPPPAGLDCDNDNDAGTDRTEASECSPPSGAANVDDVKDRAADHAADSFFLSAIYIAGAVIFPPPFDLLFIGAALTASGTGVGEALIAFDPPNPAYSQIALPFTYPAIPDLVRSCSKVAAARRAGCRAVAKVGTEYLRDASVTAALAEGLAVTLGRLSRAKNLSVRARGLQAGVAKVYMAALADALVTESKAEVRFAGELRRAGISVRLSAAQAKTAALKLARLEGIPASVVARAQQVLGLSRQDLVKVLQRGLRPLIQRPHSLDLRSLLLQQAAIRFPRPQPTTVGEVGLMVEALASYKVISEAAGLKLTNDLMVAHSACERKQRWGPVDRFIADARRLVKGPYSGFLQDAAAPLYADNLPPGNKPPTAAFSFAPKDLRVFRNGPAKATFTDKSSDAADGGFVGCWMWDFGDTASGSSNTSYERSPSHDYARAGSYTVKLTVADDDGFAKATTTQKIVVAPPS